MKKGEKLDCADTFLQLLVEFASKYKLPLKFKFPAAKKKKDKNITNRDEDFKNPKHFLDWILKFAGAENVADNTEPVKDVTVKPTKDKPEKPEDYFTPEALCKLQVGRIYVIMIKESEELDQYQWNHILIIYVEHTSECGKKLRFFWGTHTGGVAEPVIEATLQQVMEKLKYYKQFFRGKVREWIPSLSDSIR